jgi:16S rRNA processing protein RimM
MELVEIGKILKTKGFEGETLVSWHYEAINIQEVKGFFYEKNNKKTPIVVERVEPIDEFSAVIKWVQYHQKETASTLNNCSLFLMEDLAEAHFEIDHTEGWIGFEVYDDQVSIGIVSDVLDNKMQLLLELDNGILIPFVEEFIEEINVEQQQIYMQLPEGILDLNK